MRSANRTGLHVKNIKNSEIRSEVVIQKGERERGRMSLVPQTDKMSFQIEISSNFATVSLRSGRRGDSER